MPVFSRYVEIAYEVARSKGLEVDDPQQFMRDLAQEYRSRNHREATDQQARQFLRQAIQ